MIRNRSILWAFDKALNRKNFAIYIYIKTLKRYQNQNRCSMPRPKGRPKRCRIYIFEKNMINDDDHDISRVHNFNTECVFNESHSYVTPLLTVALPVGWPDWQIPSCARHEVSVEMNSSIENESNQSETQTAWSPNISLSLTRCYLHAYDFTHLRVMVSIVLPDLHKSPIKSINVSQLVNIVLKWAWNAGKSASRVSVSLWAQK